MLGECVLGRRVFGALDDLPEPPAIVDVFRRLSYVADSVEQAIAAGAKAPWTQLGVRNDTAAQRAADVGMFVVQDRCIAVVHRRLGISSVPR